MFEKIVVAALELFPGVGFYCSVVRVGFCDFRVTIAYQYHAVFGTNPVERLTVGFSDAYDLGFLTVHDPPYNNGNSLVDVREQLFKISA